MRNHVKAAPSIRFKGFTEDWEQRKLIDVADMFDNLRVPVTASERVQGNTPYYGANGIQGYVDGFTHNGEFVLIAEDGASDLINYPVNYVEGKIWVNNHAHVVSGKNSELDNLFLTARIKSMNISHWLVGGGRAKLNGDVLKKIPVTLPIYEEQTKIGAFFKQLDTTITLQQQQLSNYREMKKALLQKMFPKDGEKRPEVRFEGFTGEWEERKLGEIAKIGTGYTPSRNDKDNFGGEIIWISVSDMKSKYVHDSKEHLSEKDVRESKWIDADTLIMSFKLSVGVLAITKIKCMSNEAIANFKWENDITNNEYMYAYLSSKDISAYGNNAAQGITLNNEGLRKISIQLPCKGEQRVIGAFFKQLDDTIAHHQQQLDNYKELKKAMLQNLFI